MKLSILKNVLFDAFPEDDTTKICIFTQPKFPVDDYSKYVGKVAFCCTEATLAPMAGFKEKLPLELFHLLPENETRRFKSTPNFGITCIPTGNGSGSVMLLIEIKDSVQLYTGQFTNWREVILSDTVLQYIDKLDDIYVDNSMANLRKQGILSTSTRSIEDIVSKHDGCVIRLGMELFGFEELLLKLAQSSIKIELHPAQKILFKNCGLSDLFKYEGLPQIKVDAFTYPGKGLSIEQYMKCFDKKTIYIKLVPMEHEVQFRKIVDGLYIVSYTPHATSYDLHSMFQSLQPKRVHPLVPQDTVVSTIPPEILNDGCVVVDINKDDSDTHEQSDAIPNDREHTMDEAESHSFLELSDEIVIPDDFSSDESQNRSESLRTEHIMQPTDEQEPVDELVENEIIEIDSDDSLRSILGEHPQLSVQPTDMKGDLSVQMEIETIQQDMTESNNRSNGAFDGELIKAAEKSHSSIPQEKNEPKKYAQSHIKRPRLHIQKQIEYLPDSDDEDDENERSTVARKVQNVQAKETELNEQNEAVQQKELNNNDADTESSSDESSDSKHRLVFPD